MLFFLYVRVFNPFAQSFCSTSLESVYRRHECQKKGSMKERITNVELATFIPLVFSIPAGASRLTTKFLQHLAPRLATKCDKPYSVVMACLRAQLSFSLVRFSVLCLRGCHSTTGHPRGDFNSNLASEFLASQANLF